MCASQFAQLEAMEVSPSHLARNCMFQRWQGGIVTWRILILVRKNSNRNKKKMENEEDKQQEQLVESDDEDVIESPSKDLMWQVTYLISGSDDD